MPWEKIVNVDDLTEHTSRTDNPHQVNASQTEVEYLSGSTYKTVLDWLKTTQSAGKISGGTITDNGDGTVTVASGEGFIKTTNSDTAETKFLTWNANSSVSLADNDANYIYVKYNSGNPIITSSTSMPSDKNTNILLGIIYREGTDLHITTAGQLISNYASKDFWKDMEVNGKFQRSTGLMLSESGTRNIAITAGSIYAGLTKKNYSAFDSSGTDTYTQYYRDGSGGWTKVTGATQEDNQYYDDGSGTLKTLSNNYYTCRYVYMGVNGDVFVVYGQAQHQKIADAIEEDAPVDIPDILKSVGMLIGKIIVREGNTHFEKVYSAFETSIAFGTVADHNELGNLQGGTSGEYYHLTSAEYTKAQNAITKVEDDTNPKLGGELDAQTHSIGFTLQTYTGNVGTTTIDWTKGNKAKFTFGSGNETLVFTAPSKPCNLLLMVVQDSVGGRTLTFPSNVKWVGGTAPTLSTAANAIDIISFFYDGTNYYGQASLNFG